MASPVTLDFEKLLAPISAEEPSGVELKESDALSKFFYSVRTARTEARDAEKVAATQDSTDTSSRKNDPAHWKRVHEMAVDILATKSKDLWVAAWLIEAQTRLYQFAGLRDGFRLVRELVEKYWEGIHPRPDEEGISTTIVQIAGLMGQGSDGALLAPIDAIPIAKDAEGKGLSSADYITAYEADEKSIRKSTRADLVAKFEQASRSIPRDYFKKLIADITEAAEEFQRMVAVLEEKCGSATEGVSFSKILTGINNAAERVQRLSGEKSEAAGQTENGNATESEANSSAEATAKQSGKLISREDALRTLLQVAEFFRRTEPHSPISYALEQTVRWGKMSLPELLQEIITNKDARSDLFRLTGIPKPKENN